MRKFLRAGLFIWAGWIVQGLGHFVEIGSGTKIDHYAPVSGFYRYGWSQAIYLQSEIGPAFNIGALSYYVDSNASGYRMANQRIYIKHTTLASFPDSSYDDPASQGFTLVFDGTIDWHGPAWNEITLDTPFAYNGTDNVIVYWQNHRGAWANGYPLFRYTDRTRRLKFRRRDTDFPTDAGARSSEVPNIRLHARTPGPGLPAHPDPVPWATRIHVDNDPTLSWVNPSGTAYNTLYLSSVEDAVLRTQDVARVHGDGQTAFSSYTHSGRLAKRTTYFWRVLACDAQDQCTAGPLWRFTTDDGFSFSDTNWVAGFYQPGVDDLIEALTADTERGYVYAGGGFSMIAGVEALVLGTNGLLYAGGDFNEIGGVAASGVAQWDGTQWAPLGTGLGGSVTSLVLDGAGHLYAGGGFDEAGGAVANRVARWDGQQWHPLGEGLQGSIAPHVKALAMDSNDNLYATGWFTLAGGEAAEGVAKWDGQSWSALGDGIFWGEAHALAVDSSGHLFAAGGFSQAGDVPANNIARWDGENWAALGGGLETMAEVRALVIDADFNLYAGGINVTRAGDKPVQNFAMARLGTADTFYQLLYRAGAGGWIEGVLTQRVARGASGSPVTARGDDGSVVFGGWSDGYSRTSRTEQQVESNLEVRAVFHSAGGAELDWYARHGFYPQPPGQWSELDAMLLPEKRSTLLREFIADTNPHDIGSHFKAEVIKAGRVIHFRSSSNRLYRMEATTDLRQDIWVTVPGGGPRRGVGGMDALSDTNQPPAGDLYRLLVETP